MPPPPRGALPLLLVLLVAPLRGLAGFVDPTAVVAPDFFDAVQAVDLFYCWRSLGHQLKLSGAVPPEVPLAEAIKLEWAEDEPFPQEKFFASHEEGYIRDALYKTLSSQSFSGLISRAREHSLERWQQRSEDVEAGVVALGTNGDDPDGIAHLCALAKSNATTAAEASLEIAMRLFIYPTFESGFASIPECQGDFAFFIRQAQEGPSRVRGTALAFSAGAIKAGLLPGTLEEAVSMAARAAFDSNDPFAHLFLAVVDGEAREDASRDGFATKRADCESALAHLEAAADAVLDHIVNVLSGGLPRFDSIATNFEDAVFSAANVDAFSTRDDYETELIHLQDAAAANVEGAMVELADRLWLGAPHVGVAPRPDAARRLYARAAEEGSGLAAAQLGFIAFNEGDNVTAFKYFEMAVDLGDLSGHAGLGMMYMQGYPEHNATAALEHLLLASQEGNVMGTYNAGKLLYYGLAEVPASPKRGRALLELAANKGHIMANFDLARVIYSTPNKSSCVEAMERLLPIVHSDWSENLVFDPLQGILSFSKAKERQALKIFGLAAELLWHSPMDVGFLLEIAHGLQRDDFALPAGSDNNVASVAREPWLRTVATAAVRAMGISPRIPAWRLAEEQWRVPLAISAYSRAYRHESPEGTRKMADCYLEGWACPRDTARAVWLYKRAAELGDGHASVTLAMLRWRGMAGLERNLTAAEEDLDWAEQLDILAEYPVEVVRLLMWLSTCLDWILWWWR